MIWPNDPRRVQAPKRVALLRFYRDSNHGSSATQRQRPDAPDDGFYCEIRPSVCFDAAPATLRSAKGQYTVGLSACATRVAFHGSSISPLEYIHGAPPSPSPHMLQADTPWSPYGQKPAAPLVHIVFWAWMLK